MVIDKKGILRAAKFAGVSITILIFELGLLYTLVEFFFWNEVIAAATSLIIALYINYVVSRALVFKETERTFSKGLIIFYSLAVINITMITLSMYVAVEVFDFNYLISRVCIGFFFGFVSYLNNLYFNFKVNDETE